MSPKRRGFSLIELVIVVVIIAIIAAIAIPKMSRAASGATDSAVSQNLSQMRSAIEMFAAEHGGMYPTQAGVPSDQLTKYSDANGTVSATKTTTAIYGPYLKAIPAIPVGAAVKGTNTITTTGPAGTGTGAWLYDPATGSIQANTGSSDKDASGKLYSDY